VTDRYRADSSLTAEPEQVTYHHQKDTETIMPTYLYKNIETGEIYELQQSMRDEAYTTHPQTGVPVKRVLARPGIAFKGSGFYVTDSRPKGGEGGGGE
jgi:predicted nucleic acid-binding Zn ribbon protein